MGSIGENFVYVFPGGNYWARSKYLVTPQEAVYKHISRSVLQKLTGAEDAIRSVGCRTNLQPIAYPLQLFIVMRHHKHHKQAIVADFKGYILCVDSPSRELHLYDPDGKFVRIDSRIDVPPSVQIDISLHEYHGVLFVRSSWGEVKTYRISYGDGASLLRSRPKNVQEDV